MARDYKTSVYKKTIGIREEDLEWIKVNKGKKSSAGFLQSIISEFKEEGRKIKNE
jgi:hypothetical protein